MSRASCSYSALWELNGIHSPSEWRAETIGEAAVSKAVSLVQSFLLVFEEYHDGAADSNNCHSSYCMLLSFTVGH